MSSSHWDALLVSSSRSLGLPQPQPESIVRCYGKRPYARASTSCTAHIVGRDDGLTLCGLYVNGLIGPDNRVDLECKVCARIVDSWAPSPSEATPAPAPVRTTVRRVSCTGRLIYQHESRSIYGNITGSSVYRCTGCGDRSAIIFAGGYRVDGRTCRSAVYMRVPE